MKQQHYTGSTGKTPKLSLSAMNGNTSQGKGGSEVKVNLLEQLISTPSQGRRLLQHSHNIQFTVDRKGCYSRRDAARGF